MKKIVKNIGLVMGGVVIGVSISFSGDISAATSKLLGVKVGKVMTVSLDNKNIGDAPVIGGTSYVPVRTAANELGLEVSVEGNEIKLSTPEEEPVVSTPINEGTDEINKEELTVQISNLNVEIRNLEDVLSKKETILRRINSDTEYLKKMEESKARGSDFYSDALIETTKEGIANSKKTLSDAEAVLPKLQAKLTELESQLAALK
ncbi:putative RNase H-like nuclease (RuvC/YqgF family) [Paenibacillus sp. 4624]|uniref:hypothetical protein n=1 Tax=Paenibacillus sp. 4624 TaxID=3156453 RepID=UPI003D259327